LLLLQRRLFLLMMTLLLFLNELFLALLLFVLDAV
jgi:hypothetical protein